MPSIHVIYDPNDRLTLSPEINKKIGVAVIIIQVPEKLTENTIDSFVGDAINRIMDEVRGLD